jgi:ribose transport system ATP-binding protein
MTKSYGGVLALDSVDFDLIPGEVHAVIGENGAGKSTLIKCLSGAVVPDSGTVQVNGEPLAAWSPNTALAAGVAVVHQELSLFPALTVAENVLGARGGGTVVRWGPMFARARRLLETVDLDVDPRSRLEQLSIGQQQMVEIARAMSSGARVIILDEPTSSLSPHEVARLFSFVHRLSSTGVAFVLITHFLEDVMAHADRVTVLRNGRLVQTSARADVTTHALVAAMIGDTDTVLQATYEGNQVELPPRPLSPVKLELRDVVKVPAVAGLSLEVHEGEVLGVYGDLAAGHIEAAALTFGAAGRTDSGQILVDGRETTFRSTTDAARAGVGYIPADRREALALDQPIAWNGTLAHLHRLTGFFLSRSAERAHVAKWTDHLNIRGVGPHKTVGALSGGNQQKVLFARWLEFPPKVLVLVEPTRGMDVGAKSDVVRIVRETASKGVAVLVISTEPETVLTFSDRVLVAHRGRIVADFEGTHVSKNELMAAAHQELERA